MDQPIPTTEIIRTRPAHVANFTVTGYAVLQIPTTDEDPVIDLGATRSLETNDEHLQRKLKVAPNWTQIDYGWVESPSALVIKNVTPLQNPLNTVEAASHVVEVRQIGAGASLLLPVGWGLPFLLGPNASFQVRSDNPCTLLILVVPK